MNSSLVITNTSMRQWNFAGAKSAQRYGIPITIENNKSENANSLKSALRCIGHFLLGIAQSTEMSVIIAKILFRESCRFHPEGGISACGTAILKGTNCRRAQKEICTR